MNFIEKAFFKKCPLEDRKIFNASKCFMPMSVGMMVHEGRKLQSTLTLINRSFKECVILVDDIIQRHTVKIEKKNNSEEALLKETDIAGSEWINRNLDLIGKTLKIPYKIIRWEKWLYHDSFKEKYAEVENLYFKDPEYKKSIHNNIESFLLRYKKNKINDQSFDYEFSFQCCLDYLLEECTCMCLWVEEECEFEVYPSGRNDAMAATYEKLIQPYHSNLLRSVSLYFKKTYKKNNIVENKVLEVE